jgi:hypothetical protein
MSRYSSGKNKYINPAPKVLRRRFYEGFRLLLFRHIDLHAEDIWVTV